MPRRANTAEERWLKGVDNGPRPKARASTATVDGEEIRIPRPPSYLSDNGRKTWRKLYRELYSNDLLAAADMQAFEMLIGSYDIWRQASDAVAAHGVLVEDGRGGLRKNPALQVQRDSATTFTRIADRFAITPLMAQKIGLEVLNEQ